MFPGYSRQFYRPNQQAISRALEKSRKNELTVEDILDEEDLVNDLKSQSFSQLISCISQEKLQRLMDYISVEPTNENDHKLGFKFPYFASEILASENVFIIDKFFEEEEKDEKTDEKEKEESKMPNRSSSIIEINMGEDSNTAGEPEKEKSAMNEDKDNENHHTNILTEKDKDSKMLSFLNNSDENLEKHEEKQKVEENKVEPENAQQKTGHQEKTEEKNQSTAEEKLNSEEINKSENEINKSIVDEKKKVYHNLDYLFKFISNNSPLNYVLCGYFQKVFNHLSNYKNAYLMRYLMEFRQDVIFNMINHLNRKSIVECLFKILISYVPDFSDHEIKKEVLLKIFASFDPNDVERSSCISDLLSEILGNRRIYYLIVKNEDLLLGLHKVVIQNISSHNITKDLIKVLIKFNENLLKDVNGIATSSHNNNSDTQYVYSAYLLNNASHSEDENSLIKSHSNDNFDICNFTYVFVTISSSVDAIAKDFVNDSDEVLIDCTFNQRKKVLGLRRVVGFEYIYDILEIIINANSNVSLSQNKNLLVLTETLIASGFFKKMIQYFFEFPLNNMYQKTFNETIVLLSNKYTPENILKDIFVENDFLNKVIDFVLNSENLLDFGQGRIINSGVFAIICEMCVFLTETDNVVIKQIVLTNERMKEFSQIFALQIKDKFSKENPFQKQISLEKEKSSEGAEKGPSETYRELIEKCTETLSFTKKKKKTIVSESHKTEASSQENVNSEDKSCYDNNYWYMEPLEVALDEII